MLRTMFTPSLRGGPATVALDTLAPSTDDTAPLVQSGNGEPVPGAEIVFVDASITDLAALLAGLKPGAEVVMLDSSSDAIGQIAAALAGRDSVAAIHILADGAQGQIAFGAGNVGLDDLAAHSADLAAIGAALAPDADILLWSCNTGAGSIGQAFVEALAQATGADVAASTDPTGSAARGGDWVLEAHSGAIEAQVPLTPWGIDHYDGLLDNAPPAVAFAASPVGGEFTVNADTSGSQILPAVTTLPGGAGYVVVWSGSGPGDSSGIFVQRLDASGAAVASEILANTTTAGNQGNPSVAALSDGSFVVTWHSLEDVNFTTTVFMQRYDSSGAPLGSETQVNTSATPTHIKPAVAALSGGGYVITWNGNGTGDASGIFMQRYDNSGTALGGETLVNTTIPSDQSDAAITALSDGSYVIAWSGNGPGDAGGAFFQRFDASGNALGGETLVNTVTTGSQFASAIGALADGGFVVAFSGNGTGDADGVYAQRYDASGVAVGGAVLVNTTLSRSQSGASVVGLADGGYVISWQDDAIVNNLEIHSQRYDASGAPVGGETAIATNTDREQSGVAMTASSDGGYFIVWENHSTFDANISGQFFGTALSATEQVAHDLKGEISISDADAGDTLTVTLAVDYGVLHFEEGTSGATILSGNDSDSVIVSGTAAQIQALLGTDATSVATFTADTDTPPASATLTVTVDDGTATPVSDTTGITILAVNDAPALDLDAIDFTATGNDAAAAWSEGDAPVVLAPFAVFDDDDADGSYPGATLTVAFTANGTAHDQLSILSVGDGLGELRVTGTNVYYEGTLVGTLSGGDNGNPLVVTFNADACHCAIQLVAESITFTNDSATPDTHDRTVTITLVDGGGTDNGGFDTASANVIVSVSEANNAPTVTIDAPTIPIGGEALVNTSTDGAQQNAKIAALDDGGYVVLWSSSPSDLSSTGVHAQIYDADGTPRGGEFLIDLLGEFDFTQLSVSSVDGGGFVVAWQDVAPGFGRYVYAQRFDGLGDPQSGGVQVTPLGTGGSPVVTGLSGGGYVVTWLQDDGDGIGVHAQLYDANDTAVGSSFIVNTTTTGTQTGQAVADLTDGGFIVTWTSFGADSSFTEVFAQRFDSAGSPVGSQFLVPTTSPTGDQGDAVVTGLANGGFVISWTQAPTFSDVNVHAQLYDAAGNPVGAEFVVDTPSAALQGSSTVTALADGGFLISWKSGDSSGVGDILAQRYDASGATVGGEIHITDTPLERYAPVAAGLVDGGFAIAWQTMNEDGSGAGIAAQVYDPALSATEQVPLDLKGHITIADSDAGSDIISVTLSVSEGVLAIAAGTSGVAIDDSDPQHIVLTGTLAEIQALLGSDPTSSVSYTYDDDFLPLATIGLEVTIDDGFDSATDTVLINLTPVNDAAELDLDFTTPGNDAIATYVAGDPATPISFNATFDDDNANWDGATLTIAITGATAGDQLSIDDTLTFDITISGSNILYQGDVVGSFSGGANGAPLVVTFNADACACAIEEVSYAITYSSNAANPALSTRDVTFTFVDGGGTANGGHDTATASVALTVTPPPTPPVVDAGAAAIGNEDSPITLTGITITDDGDPTTGLVTVHLGVEHGTLTIRTDVPGGIDASNIVNSATGHGITITATPDQINATIAANGLTYLGDTNFNGTDALTITANDGAPDTPLAISSLGEQFFSNYPSAVAIHDVDGDGFNDLILGIGDGLSPSGVLILASGGSGFGGFGLASGAADAFAFGDFDGDGAVDIGIASYAADGSGYVGYYSSLTGDVVTIANIPYALDLTAGDFNGDGLMDLAAANSDSGNIAILLQTAPGVFAPPVYTSATSLLTVSIRTGDFNGDGVLDLLASNYGDSTGFAPPGSVDLFLGNGDGTFAAATQVWTGAVNADGLVVGDFNGDGIDDFAFATTDAPGGQNGVMVSLGIGDGTFAAATAYVTTASGTPGRIVAGDLNGDGILDLVVTNLDAPGTVSILLGNGDGSFQAPVTLDTGDAPNVVALGDADDDGDLDLLVGSAADGSYEAFNNDDFHRGGGGVKTIIVNGSAVAQADAASIAENATSAGNLFLDNGSGVDSDSDGDPLVIAMVNGSAANVGTPITLASGAKLTVNADGSYSYDSNGKFVTLTDGSSGAANTSATDSFTYTLAGGTTATVTITLNGVAGAGDRLQGDLTHDVIHGTGGADFFIDTTGGNEDWTGLGGNDVFLFGGTLTSADKVDGGAGVDQIAIQGDYSTQLTLGTGLIGLESLAILPGFDTRFGDPGTNFYDYNIKTVDENVAAGVTFIVDANRLRLGEDFTFDGSAETDGKFFIYGGGGTDTLIGGSQNDAFYFGESNQFGATDTVVGGGGTDQLGLRGDYTIVFGANQLTSIENIGMVSALDTRFGALGDTYDYNLTMNDGNVLAGQQMTVDAASLRAGETLTFNGSAEIDGSFRVFGGAGNDVITGSHGGDTLTGWAGADSLTGGLGNDVFRYNAASDSTTASHDTIQDFTLGDIIDLSQIDANSGVNGNQAFSLIGDAAFGHHAGELRYENTGGSTWTVQGDTDGDGIADFEVVVVIADGHSFTGGDFLL